ILFSEKFACPECGVSMEELSPRMFSFNSPYGACPTCDGLGNKMEIDPERVLDKRRSIHQGGIVPWADSHSKWLSGLLTGLCRKFGIDPDQPLSQATPEQLEAILHGTRGENVTFDYQNSQGRVRTFSVPFEGVIP